MIRMTVHRMRQGGIRELAVREAVLANEALLTSIKGASDLTITRLSDSMVTIESPHRLYGKNGIVSGGHTLRYRFYIDSSRRGGHHSFTKFRRELYEFATEHPEHCTPQVRQAMRRAA